MATPKLTPKIRQQAERVETLTLAEATALPNLLGRLCAAFLKAQGFYTCTLDGEHVLYILKDAQ